MTREASEPPGAWHHLEAAQALEGLESGPQGLSEAEAATRLERFGRNALPPPPRRPAILRFLAQFNNALIYFLLAAAVAAMLLDHALDAAVIVGVVVINAIVGFVQEGKAERALSAIRDMVAPTASVLREGHRRTIAAAELVPGDIVLIEAGDKVPADLRLLRARALLIDEAILTGESLAVEKSTDPVGHDASLGSRYSLAYSGTMVLAGQGRGIVTGTGLATEIGKISQMLAEVETLVTPLLRRINSFARGFTLFAGALSAAIFAFAIGVRGQPWCGALLTVVALAVALIPEGLPAVITITLAIGVQRMAARRAIIRRLPAVETLGSTSVICSDKTGTLTRNEMTVRTLVADGGDYRVEGTGYAPEGGFLRGEDGAETSPGSAAQALIRCAVLCNDANLVHKGGDWQVEGDPMEGALVSLGAKAGIDAEALRAEWPRQNELPFDPQTRYMATLHEVPGGGGVIFLKGAPEALIEVCDTEADARGATSLPIDRAAWQARIDAAAREGMRVLGFASKPSEPDGRIDPGDVAGGLTFLGIAGFIDPPRPEAEAAVAECRSAGIAVKMITGDHAATAEAIAAQLGLSDHPRVVTGADVEATPDADLPALALEGTVFARTNPEHKLRIVKALQSQGAIVAMTGDGVNDAPALKQADVGIAMGRKGTEAAKQAAEMVLADDNFATIVAAVHEGRTVFDNIRKVIAWTLPTNGGETVTIALALLLGLTMPIAPAQILWVNMITAVTLGLVLAFEPAEPGVMSRPPRAPDAGLLSPFLVWRVIFVSGLFVAGAFGIFAYALAQGHEIELARTMVVNTLVVMEIFYLFNVRFLHGGSITLRGVLGTPVVLGALGVVIVAQAAFTYAPPLQMLFDTRAVPADEAGIILLVGIALLLICEIEKAVFRKTGLMRRMGD